MAHNAFSGHPLKVLGDESVQRIHDNAMYILQKIGVHIDSEEALSMLADYGVRCDREQRRAYLDESVIRRALSTVAREYKVYGRKPGQPQIVDVNSSSLYAISGAGALKLYSNGEYKDASRQNLIDMISLHDKLENIHVLINVVEPAEMLPESIYPEIAALHFCYTSKPLLLQANGRKDLRKLIRMAGLIVGGQEELRKRPIFMTGTNSEPPLSISKEGAEVLITGARAGIPVSMGAYVMVGATAPVNIAASIVQRTASVLCGLVLTQAAQPGSAYEFCTGGACSDLSTGDVVTMSPRTMLLIAGSIQMGRYYGLTTRCLSATEAKVPDAQALGERFFSLAVSIMAGGNLIHGTTSEMSGMEVADFAQCVIDNEAVGYMLDFAAGISVDGFEEGCAAIEEVVTDAQYAGLYFLGHPHTAKYCRRKGYAPDLFSAGMLSRWLAKGEEPLYDKAVKRAQQLLAERELFVTPELKKELLGIALSG